jgi:hypothetical protein
MMYSQKFAQDLGQTWSFLPPEGLRAPTVLLERAALTELLGILPSCDSIVIIRNNKIKK